MRFTQILVLLFLFPLAASAKDKLWALGTVGGDGIDTTQDAFYYQGVNFDKAMISFGIKRSQRAILFGAENGTCYQTNLANKEVATWRQDFLKDPTNCALASPILAYMLNDGQYKATCTDASHNLSDLSGRGTNDLNGPSTKENFSKEIENVIANAKKGSHLSLFLIDHGAKNNGDWYFHFGDEKETLSVTDLRPYLQRLQEKGVTVHLDVETCYSGGFMQLTNNSGPASVCGTAMADTNVVGYLQDGLFETTYDATYMKNLKKYGSQLKALACSSAIDPVNKPNSSLDEIVARWEAQGVEQPSSDCSPVSNMKDLKSQVRTFAKINDALDLERKALREAYIKEFVSVMQKCATNRVLDTTLDRTIAGCVNDPRVKLDDYARKYMTDFFAQDRGDSYDMQMINRHLQFLEHADSKSLQDFKSSFCCLAYNMKTQESPKVCR